MNWPRTNNIQIAWSEVADNIWKDFPDEKHKVFERGKKGIWKVALHPILYFPLELRSVITPSQLHVISHCPSNYLAKQTR